MPSSSLSLASVRSVRIIRTAVTTRAPWRQISSTFLEGSNRLRAFPSHPTRTRRTFDHYCCKCLSTTRTLLSEKNSPPLITPKISKYRVDCNTPKIIKRRKKEKEDGKKAIPNIVRSKPVANPKKARQAAEAATREIMRKMRETEALPAAATTGAPSLATTTESQLKPSAAYYTQKPLSLKPGLSTSTTATNTPSSSIDHTVMEPALKTPVLIASQSPLPPPVELHARRIPADQPLPELDPVLSTLAEAIATQPAPISSGWSTVSPLQSYRLPLPELSDQSEERLPPLDPLPKMASSIERRPSLAPQRIKRSVYRTILDWSVHPTIQPDDFNTLPDLPRGTPPRTGHSLKSTSTSAAATSGRSERNVTTATTSTTAATKSSDEVVVRKRYVSRRRIGFDDDDLDLGNQRPYYPGQSTTQVLDTIVHNRLGKNNIDTQPNPWDISGIRRQKFVPNSDNTFKGVLLKNPVMARVGRRNDDDSLKEEKKEEETTKVIATTATSKPLQSALPRKKSEHADQTLQTAIVLPDQPLLGSWIDSPRRTYEKAASPTENESLYREYLFTPKSVLPAMTTGLRKTYELFYADSDIHPRVSQMVKECVETAGELGLDVIKTTPRHLDRLLGHKYHQGVLLRASYLPRALIKSLGVVSADNKYDINFIRGTSKKFEGSKPPHDRNASGETTTTPCASPPPIWIVLDEVQVVYDMGHILSTAYHLGIDGVIIKEKDTVLPHADVSAVSEGALEKRPAYAVKTLVKFIKESQANGWQVIGLKAAYGSKRLKPFYTFPNTGIDRPTILIVGGSGLGISKSAERQCDSFIHVPVLSHMAPSFGQVISLPVPVVSGIAMSRLIGGRFAASGSDMKTGQAAPGGGGVDDYDNDISRPVPWVGSPPEWELTIPKSKGKGNQVTHTRKDPRK